MARLSKNAIIGYPAGVITGVTYGLNPLFAMPLVRAGAPIVAILFFRYAISVVCLLLFLATRRQSLRVTGRQAAVLLVLGLLFTSSSLFLFEAYKFIPSGLATTLVFLYPVMVALIMVFLRVVPSWSVWMAIAVTFAGVTIMSVGEPGQEINPVGIALSVASALVYALFIVIVNKNKAIAPLSSTVLTFYTLVVGTVVFATRGMIEGVSLTSVLNIDWAWLNLLGLAVFPTIISTATLAVASRNIGATKASVLGVFEPITAILVGTTMLGEPLTTNIIIGVILSIASVTFMVAKTSR